MASSAEDDVHAIDGALQGIERWISCFEKAHLAGSLLVGGVNESGEAEGHSVLEKAYEMGKNA